MNRTVTSISHVPGKYFDHANHKGADQPAHQRSLISAFVIRSLDSVMNSLAKSNFSKFLLVSVAEQVWLSFTCSKHPKTGFLMTSFVRLYHLRSNFHFMQI